MTVRKNDPMDQPPATNEEFDALLAASSLKAPHVAGEGSDIPAAARHRMAQALGQLQRTLDTPTAPPAPSQAKATTTQSRPLMQKNPHRPGGIKATKTTTTSLGSYTRSTAGW
ncbi:hypothetical protein ACQPXT_40050 [Streptomyces sp. CA-100214]